MGFCPRPLPLRRASRVVPIGSCSATAPRSMNFRDLGKGESRTHVRAATTMGVGHPTPLDTGMLRPECRIHIVPPWSWRTLLSRGAHMPRGAHMSCGSHFVSRRPHNMPRARLPQTTSRKWPTNDHPPVLCMRLREDKWETSIFLQTAKNTTGQKRYYLTRSQETL